MKKQHPTYAIMLLIALIATLFSCRKKADRTAPNTLLKNEKDSINYAYGLLWGNSTRNTCFDNNKDEEKIKDFINGFNRGSKSGASNAHAYLLGMDIAKNIQQKEENGILSASFKTSKDLIHQGVVNAILNKERLIHHKEAVIFYQKQLENTDLPVTFKPTTKIDQPTPPAAK
ncbi:MAG: hypothetical protein LBH80_03565 [Prevotellaceae bacterium]|jgi:hypothetical protein|nr:hypothetical protein [Prevotellaceae bacterium]